jgi:ribosomal-protein-alanine N-acetyltransferase
MIHSANKNHLDEILNIEKMAFTKPWTRKQLQNDLMISENSENWVYMEDQQVIGYVLGWKVMDEFHLNNIAVHLDFQRRHIGRSLVEHVKNRLQIQNIQRIYLEVSGKNKPAQRLYESMGFQKKGLRRDYYAKEEHAFLYHLKLIDND